MNDGPPRGLGLASALFAFVVVAFAFVVAHLTSATERGQLRAVNAATPIRGTITYPNGRVTPRGIPAAAFWWSVIEDTDEDPETYCDRAETSGMVLVEEKTGKQYPLAMFDQSSSIGTVWDGHDDDLDSSSVIDLGSTEWEKWEELTMAIPAACKGDDRHYIERYLREGQTVELYLGPRGTVLSADGLEAHRERVAADAKIDYLVAAGVAIITVILMGVAVLLVGKRVAGAVR